MEKIKLDEHTEMDAAMKPLYDDLVEVFKKHGAFFYIHGEYEDIEPTIHIPNDERGFRDYELNIFDVFWNLNDDAGTNEIPDRWCERRTQKRREAEARMQEHYRKLNEERGF